MRRLRRRSSSCRNSSDSIETRTNVPQTRGSIGFACRRGRRGRKYRFDEVLRIKNKSGYDTGTGWMRRRSSYGWCDGWAVRVSESTAAWWAIAAVSLLLVLAGGVVARLVYLPKLKNSPREGSILAPAVRIVILGSGALWLAHQTLVVRIGSDGTFLRNLVYAGGFAMLGLPGAYVLHRRILRRLSV